NSRLKDFYDLYVLASLFAFDGLPLARAIRATFDRRSTPIELEIPSALTPGFFGDLRRAAQWRGYLERSSLPGAPRAFEIVGELLIRFLEPVRASIGRTTAPPNHWPPSGPWRTESAR
ncbi:MAG TPA: nucleotidyl transferase AbiEii/AbiGii toxin family protein, partial [Planctomycetota bacterium]|nr:nucleotidyl transferase AbiEii/AbiGii toxin family protein [Planctomycetota bacterium]